MGKSRMKTEYQHFKKMMNHVGKDLVDDANGKTIYLAYSGGLDSTAILLSLKNSGGNVNCVHGKKYKNDEEWWYRFQEDLAAYICEMLDTPLKILPYDPYKDEVNWFYPIFSQLKIDKIISGDGMDTCYMEMYDKKGELICFTFGEYIHAKYWLFDLFLYIKYRLRGVSIVFL